MKQKKDFLYRVEGLLCDERTGRFVASKLAVSTGYLSALVWFNYHNYKSGFSSDEWLIFLAAAGVLKAAEKIIGMKYSSGGYAAGGSVSESAISPAPEPYNESDTQGDRCATCKYNNAN